jgi:hypothetical protein
VDTLIAHTDSHTDTMPVLDQIFACIVKSDLNRLIHYLKKDPSLVNAKEEVCKMAPVSLFSL